MNNCERNGANGTHFCGCDCHEARHAQEIADLTRQLDEARARIAELDAAQRWVPVTEALPELEVEVDVWWRFGRKANCYRVDTGEGWLWSDADGDESTFADDLPTHWREVPAAPESPR